MVVIVFVLNQTLALANNGICACKEDVELPFTRCCSTSTLMDNLPVLRRLLRLS
jgi:hypothetical protein